MMNWRGILSLCAPAGLARSPLPTRGGSRCLLALPDQALLPQPCRYAWIDLMIIANYEMLMKILKKTT